MTTNPMETVDSSWKGLYKWGGILALLAGVLYILFIALAIGMGIPPSGAEDLLKYYSGQTTLAYSAYGLEMLADILLLPAVFALYLTLKGINKNAMLAASGFGGLFVALDLGVIAVSAIALVTLSQNYAAATSDIQRTAYVATASYSLAVISVSERVFSSVIPSLWGLITGVVMLRGIFSKSTAYLGIAASIVGFAYSISIFAPSLAILVVIEVLIFAVWFMLAGYRLYRLGKR